MKLLLIARFSLSVLKKQIDADCKEYFSKSLFLVGEIGGNDYNYAFFKGKSLDDAKSYVPTVATAIIDATEVSAEQSRISKMQSCHYLLFKLQSSEMQPPFPIFLLIASTKRTLKNWLYMWNRG